MKTVLLIEDNIDILENVAELLEYEGYQAIMATNGYDGVKIARQVNPDLVVCDIMMSGLDGYQVLDKLSAHPESRNIPFIFLTAKAEKHEKKYGLDLGADDYLIKPVSEEDLFEAVENCLNKKSKLAQKYKGDLKELDDYIRTKRGQLLEWLSDSAQQSDISTVKIAPL